MNNLLSTRKETEDGSNSLHETNHKISERPPGLQERYSYALSVLSRFQTDRIVAFGNLLLLMIVIS